jgi:L-fucose mutarotase
MLKNIDPLLFPDLLKLLCEMGHGDEIVVADANFTAESLSPGRPVLRLPGISLARACRAVLSVFPLDEAVACPVAFMQVSGSAPGSRSALQREVLGEMLSRGEVRAEQCEAVERFEFYKRTRAAFAILQVGEMQPYANFLFKKGVIAEALRP